LQERIFLPATYASLRLAAQSNRILSRCLV
jgi:hypothetical protein